MNPEGNGGPDLGELGSIGAVQGSHLFLPRVLSNVGGGGG